MSLSLILCFSFTCLLSNILQQREIVQNLKPSLRTLICVFLMIFAQKRLMTKDTDRHKEMEREREAGRHCKLIPPCTASTVLKSRPYSLIRIVIGWAASNSLLSIPSSLCLSLLSLLSRSPCSSVNESSQTQAVKQHSLSLYLPHHLSLSLAALSHLRGRQSVERRGNRATQD